MRGKPQIIIGAKVQSRFPIYHDLGALRAGNGPFRFVETRGFDLVDFLSYPAYKIFIHILKLKRKYNPPKGWGKASEAPISKILEQAM